MEEERGEHGHYLKNKKKTGGRKTGTPNKSTQMNRDRIDMFFSKHWDEFENEIWDQLDPKEKKNTFIALMNYRYPKLTSVDLKQESKVSERTIDLLQKMVGDSNII